MPQFQPNVIKMAVVPIRVSPSGLSCEAEIFLGPNELTKVATSGMVPFISTGAQQAVHLPVGMPSAEGTYHVYIDVYAGGILIAAYRAIEDVVITAGVAEFAYVSDIEKHYADTRTDYFTVDVQNISSFAGTCTLEFWRLKRYTYEWELVATISHTIQPGGVKTFGDISTTWVWTTGGYNYPDHWYAKFIGPPGEVSIDGWPR